MQHTQNYQLPTWEKEDRILMEDFNSAMSNIESAIDGVKNQAEGAASAAGEAQTAAERAEGKADAAQATADAAYRPDNKPYVTGTYTGTGAEQTVSVGFTPGAVIIGVQRDTAYPLMGAQDLSFHRYISGTDIKTYLSFTSTGFLLSRQDDRDTPNVNHSGDRFSYIAFK